MNRKDKINLYMFRNGFLTITITLLTFIITLTNYYHCTIQYAFTRLFHSIYTYSYFILLWILNYLLFEIYKVTVELFKSKKFIFIENYLSTKLFLSLVFGCLILFIGLMNNIPLFKINFILLSICIFARTGKQWYLKKL